MGLVFGFEGEKFWRSGLVIRGGVTALSKRGRVSNAETKSFSRGKLDDWVSQRKEGRCLDLSECMSGASGRSFGFEGERIWSSHAYGMAHGARASEIIERAHRPSGNGARA